MSILDLTHNIDNPSEFVAKLRDVLDAAQRNKSRNQAYQHGRDGYSDGDEDDCILMLGEFIDAGRQLMQKLAEIKNK